AFRADVAALNPETLEALKAGLEEREGRDSADALREVERRFGFRAYGERLRRILDSFGRGGDRQGPPGERVQESLLEEFATIDQLRLLFG
ncbi:MAG: hypothetical protein ACOC47_09395, partial [Alkalispirochaetaceae bacterium]